VLWTPPARKYAKKKGITIIEHFIKLCQLTVRKKHVALVLKNPCTKKKRSSVQGEKKKYWLVRAKKLRGADVKKEFCS